MSTTTLLLWYRVYGTYAVYYAECALGRFHTRTISGRTVLTLNDVAIGNHRDLANARAQADLLIELPRRRRRDEGRTSIAC